jgi:FMN phosphatase YigB (HAD superfamily)
MFLIDRIYISDKIGYQKPNINFFNYIFDDLNNHQRKDYIIVGDSLTSDILGGKNSGITTVWYNPNHEKNDKNIIPDYEIDNLKKIEGILNDKKSYN